MKGGNHARIVLSLVKSFSVVIVALLTFTGFILQFVGVADKTQECTEAVIPSCSEQLYFVWWSVYFEISVISTIGILAGFDVLCQTQSAALAVLSIATVEMIHGAERFIGDQISPGEKAAVVGFVFSVMGNFILIFLIGGTNQHSHALHAGIKPDPSDHEHEAEGDLLGEHSSNASPPAVDFERRSPLPEEKSELDGDETNESIT